MLLPFLFDCVREAELSVCPKYFIPVAEVWSKISVGFLVVHVVFAGPSIDAKRYQTRRGPGEVIATVILYRNVDVHHHEHPCGEEVAPQDHRIQGCPEADRDQLPATQTLSSQSKRSCVVMMDGVEGDVEPADPVMQQVPDEILEVKQQEVPHDSGNELQHRWSQFWQVHRWPPCPLGH